MVSCIAIDSASPVPLITEQGYTVAKAADALGVATNVLYRWKENAEKQKAGISLAEEQRAELKGLRQEVKTLRVERVLALGYRIKKGIEFNPVGLVFRDQVTYLVGTYWKCKDLRQLAVHRITSCNVTDVSSSLPEDFNLQQYEGG